MRFLRSTIGFMIAGMLVQSVWGAFAGAYGILGGVAAAFLIIGPMWYMNHYVGLIQNDDDAGFVDMAMGIAVAGTMRDTFINGGQAFVDALPTLLFVAIGAVIGGTVAALIEKDMAKKDSEKLQEVEKISA